MSLNAKTLFITGASRGIGREIALRAARDGANVVIAAKSAEPHPKLAGTIFSVAEEVEAAGGKALALQLDVRDENAVREAMARAMHRRNACAKKPSPPWMPRCCARCAWSSTRSWASTSCRSG